MLDHLLIDLGIGGVSTANPLNSRRKYARRVGIHSEIELEGKIFQLSDWSRGGILFDPGQETKFRTGDRINFVLRFFFPAEVMEISHQGEIVRNNVDKAGHFNIGIKFDEMEQQTRREFERVIDSTHTEELLGSYAAA